MCWTRPALLFVAFLAAGAVLGSETNEPPFALSDEAVLKNAGIPTDNAGLLEFFRKRTMTSQDQNKVAFLVRQLGDESFRTRETATSDLIGLGVIAVPSLRQAVKSTDPEVVRRAEECLRSIEERGARVAVPLAAAHVLALRKPPGAAEVLLGFLPFAEQDNVGEEIKTALAAVAIRDGKPEQILIAALKDPVAERRAVAAELLCQAGLGTARADVKELLHDADLNVRLRASSALAGARDKAAVPVLIDLLAKLPVGQARQAEDMLLRIADDQSPDIMLGFDEGARQKCSEAWAHWWQDHEAKIEIPKLNEKKASRGYTLIVMFEKGAVAELDANNRPRFQIEGLQLPLDAQMLPGDRVLIAEHNANRVTERNRKGMVLWQKQIASPLVAQRLPNGHTFIATQSIQLQQLAPQLVEVDRDGKVVFSFSFPTGESIMKAAKLPNGDIACVTNARRFVRLDAAGKELQSFPNARVMTIGGRLEVLPSGHVLIPEKENHRVVEYDSRGRVIWELPLPMSDPVAAVRLPNGNTLVTSYDHRGMGLPTPATEYDREGNEVWSYKSDTPVTRAFRR